MKSLSPPLINGFVAVVLSACGGDSTEPTILTLQNDSYAGGGTAAFDGWWDAGDGVGTFFPARASAYSVRNVRFLFGGSATPQTVTLTLFTVVGNTRLPIYTHDHPLTPSDASFQEIDLSGAGVQVPVGSGLLIAVVYQHKGLPGIAIDSDGRTGGGNWLFVGSFQSWYPQENYLVDGDWIVRAEIEED